MWYHFAPPTQTRSIRILIDMFYVFWSMEPSHISIPTSEVAEVKRHPFPFFDSRSRVYSWLEMILPMRKDSRDRECTARDCGLACHGNLIGLGSASRSTITDQIETEGDSTRDDRCCGISAINSTKRGQLYHFTFQFVTNKISISIWKNIWSLKRNSEIDFPHGFYYYYPVCGC